MHPIRSRLVECLASDHGSGLHLLRGLIGASVLGLLLLPAQASAQCASAPNPIVCENALPGTSDWRISGPISTDVGAQVQGFASATSVDTGGSIDFLVTVAGNADWNLEIYRMGWYGGDGGRLMLTETGRTGVAQGGCTNPADVNASQVCNWSVAAGGYTLAVPTTWTTGLYLAKLETTSTGHQAYIPFVVREDDRVGHARGAQGMQTFVGPDGRPRCRWCGAAPEFLAYHDEEWGFPVADDRRLFEKLSLEAFQSGLSWRTILAKRESFRAAFHDFDFERVARFSPRDVERLLGDAGIVRHRGKIEAVVNNARRAQELVRRDGSLARFFWRYEPERWPASQAQTASTSAESIALSKDLKKLGWKFVGPTTVFAFMQAMGLVNDHAADCSIRPGVVRARRAFERPVG